MAANSRRLKKSEKRRKGKPKKYLGRGLRDGQLPITFPEDLCGRILESGEKGDILIGMDFHLHDNGK